MNATSTPSETRLVPPNVATSPGRLRAAITGPALIVVLCILALLLRIAVRDFVMDDMKRWVIPWYDYLRTYGTSALGTSFPNDNGFADTWGSYTPPYYYLLYVAAYWDGVAPKLYLIKAVSVAFDVVAALFMFKIVLRTTDSSGRAWAAALAVLLAPTLILNSALWGQCDSIHSSMLLGSVYFFLSGRALRGILFLGIALSVKAQGVFLVPFVLMLVFQGSVPWAYLPLVPLTYVALMLPAVFLGRSIVELLEVYFHQGQLFSGLSMNAPNLYYFVSNTHYGTGVAVGILLTMVGSLLFALLPRWRRASLTPELVVLAATMSMAMAPFLLPKMHDRYFLSADLMSIGLAFTVPRFWFVPLGFQLVSTLAYVPAMSFSLTASKVEYRALMPLAVVLNVLLIGTLAVAYWRAVRRAPAAA